MSSGPFRSPFRTLRPALALGLLAVGACTVERGAPAGTDSAGAPATAGGAAGADTGGAGGVAGGVAGTSAGMLPGDSLVDPKKVKPEDRPRADMRLEVDVAARQLRVFRGAQQVAAYPVGVGTTEWPTKPGQWVVSQVVWNPEFIPPDQSWAEERDPKKPGATDNPLGMAQLIYDPPRTVHGTNRPESVGKASSHGSIRMRNEDIVRLAQEVQQIGAAGRDSAWYQQVQTNRTEKVIVDLPRVVPITVR